jgi:hypothetical protein
MARSLKSLWPRGDLWRHPDFLKLWSAQTISQFGSAITGLALPLAAILVLHASAFRVALLTTIDFLPFLLFSLPAGVWVEVAIGVSVAFVPLLFSPVRGLVRLPEEAPPLATVVTDA